MLRRNLAFVVALVAGLALAGGLAGCGGSGKSTSSSSPTAVAAVNSSGASGSAAGAATALAPYMGHPSAFPVVDKLAKDPKGATIAYMDCGLPYCALFYKLMSPAASMLGVKLERIDAGKAANTVNAAFDTVIAQKPAAVIVTSIPIQLWANKLKQLQAENVHIVTTGVTGMAPYGVPAPQAAEPIAGLAGKLIADYVATRFGADKTIVVYTVPQLTFTEVIASAFRAQLPAVCASCTVRTVPIPVASIGSTAPNTIVSDLQSHPGTNLAVLTTDESGLGLPSAMKAAGLSVKTIGWAPIPASLEYVKAGEETATLGVDTAVLSYELIDQAAREITGQPLSGAEAKGFTDQQFLTQSDITFNPSNGWTGYPDFAHRFAALWGVAG
jgi:ribose transport system substrate-binding protein